MAKKRRYIVVPRTQNAMLDGLNIGKGKFDFGGKTARYVSDPTVAAEIDTQYGLKGTGDVWVEQDERLEWHEKHDALTDGKNTGIHHYTFGGMWTDEAWERYQNKKKEAEQKQKRKLLKGIK